MKTSPLNNLKIASPCSANWDEMHGDERKRFCGECKLNVYNLSGMTKIEAENLLTKSEGRVCVRFYRRSDGTVLTEDCPVGWAKVKKNLSRAATAVFSLIVGLFGGLLAFSFFKKSNTAMMGDVVPANISVTTKGHIENDNDPYPPVMMGTPMPIREEKGEPMMGLAPIKIESNKKRSR